MTATPLRRTQAGGLLADIAAALGDAAASEVYAAEAAQHVARLQQHWSDAAGVYCDVGSTGPARPSAGSAAAQSSGGADDVPMGLVCHPGYVSLFPLLLRLLPATAPELGRLLDVLADPAQLWSPFGLRSLSRADAAFGTDENYWRGAVWINCNFLALQVRRAVLPVRGGLYRPLPCGLRVAVARHAV